MKYRNGTNRIESYDLFNINIDFPKRAMMNKIQFSINCHMSSDVEEFRNQFRRLKHSFKQLIYNSSKDGYYKKDYCFISKVSDVYELKGKGLLTFELFLYLEETYERKFILDYLLTLFNKIHILFEKDKFFTFSKYNPIRKRLA